RQDRRAVHAHHRNRPEALAATAAGRDTARYSTVRRTASPDTAATDRRGGARKVSAQQVRRPETLLAGRRRKPDPPAGRTDPARRCGNRARDRDRDGAPRTA